jgi:type II secretory ATPase GspE/PulE/Tfp pilus assembly ATPase PilB-like protein
VGSETRENRLPLDPSTLAGYVAYTGRSLNIKDVYNEKELKEIDKDLQFDPSWDKKTGYRTKAAMATPIVFNDEMLGVIVVLNKYNGDVFNIIEVEDLEIFASQIGIAFKEKLEFSYQTWFSYLIDKNIISHDEIKRAMVLSRKSDKGLETILMNYFNIEKKDIGTSLSQYYGCKFVQYNDKFFIPRELVRGINLEYLKKAMWVPIEVMNKKVTIAIDNPRDIKITEIKNLIRAGELEFQVAMKEDILKFIETLEKDRENDMSTMLNIADELVGNEEDEGDDEELNENLSIIVRLANQIIIEGFEKEASDIHIEPEKARKTTYIRFRIDGDCMQHLVIPYSYTNALVSRIKIMSDLDISEKRLPQDGKIRFRYKNKVIELRVATVPTVKGENLVMRLLAANEPVPLNKINLSTLNYNNFKELIERPYGIILVVGPTGSGKTTTLHSALKFINTSERKIWTAEDPVEITQEGLCQAEVKSKINYTFAAALRSFLRADPDVIMVGEMRDYETASIGIEASLTGHLVLSTMHTNSAPETIIRLIDIGIDPFNFADAILGILAQRLVRTLCVKCKEPYYPEQEEFKFLVSAYGGEEFFSELNIEYDDNLTLYRKKGCDFCNQTGYGGRTALHELLIGTKELKMLIQKKEPVEKLRWQAIKDGMRTLHQDGISKVYKGYTDYKQVRNVCIPQQITLKKESVNNKK